MSAKYILVPTDFSREADAALKQACAIAQTRGLGLHLLHCEAGEIATTNMPYFTAMPESYYTQLAQIRGQAQRQLESAAADLRGQGLDVATTFADGHAEDLISKATENTSIAAVVVGSHGRTGVTRWLLGSVSEGVARRSKVDVLVQRGEAKPGGFSKILVATDFSSSSELALRRATELVADGGEIELLHMWSLPGGDPGSWGSAGAELRRSICEGAAKFAAKSIDAVKDADVTINFREAEGHARRGIEERAEEGGFDLVCLGAHGHSRVQRLLIGSTAEGCLRHLKLPVYLAKESA